MQYPLEAIKIVTQADLDAGRVNLGLHYMDYVHQINIAFYTGYIMAICKSKKEFDSMTAEDKVMCMILAKATAEQFYSKEEA